MKRNYPEKLIDNEIREVRFFPANLQNKKPEKGVPFAVTCHPILNSLSKINLDNIYLLNMNEELSHQELWSHFEVYGSFAVIWFGLSYIHCKEKYVPHNVVKDDVKFAIM